MTYEFNDAVQQLLWYDPLLHFWTKKFHPIEDEV